MAVFNSRENVKLNFHKQAFAFSLEKLIDFNNLSHISLFKDFREKNILPKVA